MQPIFTFQWHITDACDQRCKHCYIFSEANDKPLASMAWEDMPRVIEQCEELCERMGARPYLNVTGGDPILHPDFWRLAELLHERGVMWSIMGNPFHLTPQVCERLKSLDCRKYQVSIDGLEKTHDAFRKPGSFAASRDAIQMIMDAGMWSAVMTTVSSVNAHELPEIIDLVASWDVDVFAFARYCPTSQQRRDEFHMEPLAYRELLLRCQERMEAHEAAGCKTTFQRKDHLWKLLEYEQGRFTIPEGLDPTHIYDGCHCAIAHITILPDGDVYACRRMASKVGNVAQTHLVDLFLGEEMEGYRDFDRFKKCSKCELFGWCRGCPAVTAGYTGDMYDEDPQCWKVIEEEGR